MRAESSTSESTAMSIGGFRLNGFAGSRLGRFRSARAAHVDAADLASSWTWTSALQEIARATTSTQQALQPGVDAGLRIAITKFVTRSGPAIVPSMLPSASLPPSALTAMPPIQRVPDCVFKPHATSRDGDDQHRAERKSEPFRRSSY